LKSSRSRIWRVHLTIYENCAFKWKTLSPNQIKILFAQFTCSAQFSGEALCASIKKLHDELIISPSAFPPLLPSAAKSQFREWRIRDSHEEIYSARALHNKKRGRQLKHHRLNLKVSGAPQVAATCTMNLESLTLNGAA